MELTILCRFPYILLALKDFTGCRKKLKTPFVFRFVLKEKKPKDIEKIWEGTRFHLHRIFEGGKTMKFPEGNPYPVTRENWEAYSKDYQWLGEEKYRNLLRGLESAFYKK